MSTKTLTQEDLKNVIAYACSLQEYDRRRQDQKLLEGIVRRETEKEGVALPVVYEIGNELEIPREYLERAVELLYPSKEQMRRDLWGVGARPSKEAIFQIYRRRLHDALKRNMPSEETSVKEDIASSYSDNIFNFYRILRRKGKIFTVTRKEKIARLLICKFTPPFSLSIELYHPFFLQGAGKELRELNELFKEYIPQPRITYHYSDPYE